MSGYTREQASGSSYSSCAASPNLKDRWCSYMRGVFDDDQKLEGKEKYGTSRWRASSARNTKRKATVETCGTVS